MEKINQMCIQFSPEELAQFHAVKSAFDPKGLLNPGKALPTLHRCAEFGAMHVHRNVLPFPELERFLETILMSQAQAMKPATLYEQLLALPENLVCEIIDGELHTQPRPSGRHGLTERSLTLELAGPFDKGRGGPGGWWIIPEPELHFVRDTIVAVPDLAGWRRERMPAMPEDHRFEVVPDWVCEILSPSTLKKDRIKKLPLYAHYGVAHAWLVDPLARTLEAFSLTEGHWLLIDTLQDDAPVKVPPFDAVTFSLADLWT